ncbi:MAG TPA: hypothetical protein VGM82_08710 [Gemmatimonadaceae bacterium]|jgi:hypothetical protein
MKLGLLAPTAITALAVMLFTAPTSASAQTTTQKETVCKDGTTVHGTAADICGGHGGLRVAASTTVRHKVTCGDGTIVDTNDGCSIHGGVKSTSNVTRTMTETKKRGWDKDSTRAIALCKDGLYSHAAMRSKACDEHGGVEHFLHRAK